MRALVIDSGGRGHALVRTLAQSTLVRKLFAAPGNAGTEELATNVALKPTDVTALADFAEHESIDLTVVGTEKSLAAGIVDIFRARGLCIVGPTKRAAEIETSKVFAKKLMDRGGIPTAPFKTYSEYFTCLADLQNWRYPVFVKESGLADGKGAHDCASKEKAHRAVEGIMLNADRNETGKELVIETKLNGLESTAQAFCDGKTFKSMPLVQDHKLANEGDTGNRMTGGMGVVTLPDSSVFLDAWADANNIIGCTLARLRNDGINYSGILYPGLMMLTSLGLTVLEYNARFGDPECQVYMQKLASDLAPILLACTNGSLEQCDIRWHKEHVACITYASEGYPDKKIRGPEKLTGIKEAEASGAVVYHCGTKRVGNELFTNGGRVLSVVAKGSTLKAALEHAYAAIKYISFAGGWYRKDIGAKLLRYEGSPQTVA